MEVTVYTKLNFEILSEKLDEDLFSLDKKDDKSKLTLSPTADANRNPTVSFDFELPGEPLEINFSLNRDDVIYMKNYFDAWLKNNPALRIR